MSRPNIGTDGGDYHEIHNQGLYVEGDIQVVLQSIDSSSRPRNEKTLLQQVGAEIESRLRQSLHNHIFINLSKEKQSEQVKRPSDDYVKGENQVHEKLSPETTIQQVFNYPDIQGRLLILGQPGSGKTTTMLNLAKTLFIQAQSPNELIPVLVNLSSWTSSQQSIPKWLAEELKVNYGISTKLSQKWLGEQKLLILMDGLDEVRSEYQHNCVKELNSWIRGNVEGYSPSQLVICSRFEEYQNLPKLQINGAVYLKELTSQQIEYYLKSTGSAHLCPLILHNINLLRSPLFLSIVSIVDRHLKTPEKLQNLYDTDDAKSLLIDLYIKSRFKDLKDKRTRAIEEKNSEKLSIKERVKLQKKIERLGEYPEEKMYFWLAYLSKYIADESDFLVEKIQPSRVQELSSKTYKSYFLSHELPMYRYLYVLYKYLDIVLNILSKFRYELITYMTFLVLFGWPLFNVLGIIFSPIFVIIQGLPTALIYSAWGLTDISLVEKLTWSWKDGWLGFIFFTVVGLFFGLFWGVLGSCIFGLINSLKFGLSIQIDFESVLEPLVSSLLVGVKSGLSFGILVGIIGALFFGFSGTEIEEKKFINQGIWHSFKFSLVQFLTGFLCGLLVGFNDQNIVILGLSSGLLFSLFSGLGVGLRHCILRFSLYTSGDAPWNYAKFLVICSDFLLLQRVGGRFRFIHRTVQEHFAAMEF
ncbi:MAG: NACHT domain-containing protein [Cyanobacteria bacterium P01_H01_bin.105]